MIMKATVLCFGVVALLNVGCNTKESDRNSDEIIGAYAREYSFVVKNPETGAEIGMRTVRDTIVIKTSNDQYEVSNRKWTMNDYDQEGWRSMEHMDDRPFRSYTANFDNEQRTLSADGLDKIYIDGNADLFRDVEKIYKYKKVD